MADQNAETIPASPDNEPSDEALEAKYAEDLAAFEAATGSAPDDGESEAPTQDVSDDDSEADAHEADESSGVETGGDWELERAQSLLVLDGADKSTVEAMDRERVLEWYARVKSRRDKSEEAIRERAELRKQLDAVNATSADSEGAPSDSGVAVASTIQPFVDELASQLGEDVGAKALDALTKAIEGSAKAVRDQVLAEVRQDTSQAITQATEAERARAAVRSRLSGEYPQLAEDSNWHEFERTASTLIKTGDYEGRPQDAWKHAARILQLAEQNESADAAGGAPVEDSETKPRKPKPTPTAPNRSTAPKAPTKEDEDRSIFNKVMAKHGR